MKGSTLEEYVIILSLDKPKTVEQIHQDTGINLSTIDSFCHENVKSMVIDGLTWYMR